MVVGTFRRVHCKMDPSDVGSFRARGDGQYHTKKLFPRIIAVAKLAWFGNCTASDL